MTHLVWIIPLCTVVLSVIGFFIVRYFNQQDKQSERLVNAINDIKDVLYEFKTNSEVHQVRTKEKLEQHEKDICEIKEKHNTEFNRINKNVGLLFRKQENLEKQVLKIEVNPKLKKHG